MIDMNSEGNAYISYLLILGCQRSGTSLLSSILGAHPSINMRIESFDDNILKAAGKPINGNKLLLHRQVQFYKRSSLWGYLVNRVVNIGKKGFHQHNRLYPISQMCINDYISINAKIIIITRSKDSTIKSMINRAKFTAKKAEKEYKKAIDLIDKIKHLNTVTMVKFEDLVTKPIETTKNICDWLNIKFDERILKGSEYNFIYPNKPIDPQKA